MWREVITLNIPVRYKNISHITTEYTVSWSEMVKMAVIGIAVIPVSRSQRAKEATAIQFGVCSQENLHIDTMTSKLPRMTGAVSINSAYPAT